MTEHAPIGAENREPTTASDELTEQARYDRAVAALEQAGITVRAWQRAILRQMPWASHVLLNPPPTRTRRERRTEPPTTSVNDLRP